MPLTTQQEAFLAAFADREIAASAVLAARELEAARIADEDAKRVQARIDLVQKHEHELARFDAAAEAGTPVDEIAAAIAEVKG